MKTNCQAIKVSGCNLPIIHPAIDLLCWVASCVWSCDGLHLLVNIRPLTQFPEHFHKNQRFQKKIFIHVIQFVVADVSNYRTHKTNKSLNKKMKNSTFGLIALAALTLIPASTLAAPYANATQTNSTQNLHQEFQPSQSLIATRVTPVKGHNASLVAYQGGAFVQVNGKEWVERNSNGTYKFKEVNRDEWSVYLQATDRPVSIQLDLWTKEVKYSDPSNSFVLYQIQTAQPKRINGWMASQVKYQGGAFVQANGKEWVERNFNGTYKFKEVNRDEWSVYLQATDRPVTIQLDLWTKEVKYSDPSNSFVIYQIQTAQI